jgi:drug/metabolite transporter (DMT)-like permease
MSLALWRYLIALGCLLPPALFSSRIRVEPRDALPIALLGIMQFGILIVLLNYALQFIPSAHAALLLATMPLMTLGLGAALHREPFTAAKALGVLVTLVGVGLVLGEKALAARGEPGAWSGEVAVLMSALSGAVCSVLYQPYLRKYPTLPVSALAMLAAVVFLAAAAAWEGFFTAAPAFTSAGWAAVGFIGISSGIGYFLWLWALNHTTPTRVTVFLALSPVTAAALGAAFLGEALSPVSVLGVACVAMGLWVAHRPPRHASVL